MQAKMSWGGIQVQGDLVVQDAVGAASVFTKTRVFISYSRKDMAFADKLEAALKERGFEVLIDREEIYAFEDWWKRIEGLIGQSDTVLFVLSPDSVKSDVALKEVTHAASLNKRFAPIVCRRIEDDLVPEALRRLNFIFFDEPEKFGASADCLVEALRTDIGWIREHTRFGETAREWVAGGHPNSLLLRPPTLDVAEYWMASRPQGAPEPTEEIRSFLATSRKIEVAARRRSRILNAALFTLLIGIIIVLAGWINQATIMDEWRWYTIQRPFVAAYVWPYALTADAERALKPDPSKSFRECAPKQESKDYCPDMVVVPSGSFTMGATPTENRAPGYTVEIPQHEVTIAKPFAVSKYELTFAEWDTCVAYGGCANDVSYDGERGQRPVVNVTWFHAYAYAAWLSRVTGKTYRLLSESEYEYATRAGTTTAYPWGDDPKLNGQPMANCNACGSQWDNEETAPVGSFAPNKFGLYDMVGNVWEWTEDCFHPNYNGAPTDGSAWQTGGNCKNPIVRGGSWGNDPELLRSANRSFGTTDSRNNNFGFRVARTLLIP